MQEFTTLESSRRLPLKKAKKKVEQISTFQLTIKKKKQTKNQKQKQCDIIAIS